MFKELNFNCCWQINSLKTNLSQVSLQERLRCQLFHVIINHFASKSQTSKTSTILLSITIYSEKNLLLVAD